MLDILMEENIDRLIASFLNTSKVNVVGKGRHLNSELVYREVVGILDYAEVSEVDRTKQANFVNYSTQAFEFMDGYSPADGYMSKDNFCRAYSADCKPQKLAHRLYFNFGDERIDFVDLVIRRLKSKNLPFMIKWDKRAVRKDNVVMYIEADKLDATVQALSEIISTHPEFATPRDLPMSVVNGGWFGYGVEDPNDMSVSYNQRVTNCVTRAMVRAFSKFRKGFDIDNLSDFAELLMENCKDLKMEKGASYSDIHQDRTVFMPVFAQNAMRLALDLVGSGEGSVGFATTQDGKDAVAGDAPIRTMKSAGRSIDITPTAVMDTLLSLIKQDEVSFNLTKDKHVEFVATIKEELMKELSRDGLPTELPSVLQSIATIDNPYAGYSEGR